MNDEVPSFFERIQHVDVMTFKEGLFNHFRIAK